MRHGGIPIYAKILFTYFVLFSVNVHMPKDRVTQAHQGYGFVEFLGEEDADYAIKIMNMIKLYGKPIRVNKVCVSLHSDFFFLPVMFHSAFSASFWSTLCLALRHFQCIVCISALQPHATEKFVYKHHCSLKKK